MELHQSEQKPNASLPPLFNGPGGMRQRSIDDCPRGNLILASYAAHRPPVVPEAATGWVDISIIKAQEVSDGTTANRTRPVDAVDAGIVQGAAIDIARPYKVVRIGT